MLTFCAFDFCAVEGRLMRGNRPPRNDADHGWVGSDLIVVLCAGTRPCWHMIADRHQQQAFRDDNKSVSCLMVKYCVLPRRPDARGGEGFVANSWSRLLLLASAGAKHLPVSDRPVAWFFPFQPISHHITTPNAYHSHASTAHTTDPVSRLPRSLSNYTHGTPTVKTTDLSLDVISVLVWGVKEAVCCRGAVSGRFEASILNFPTRYSNGRKQAGQ